MSSERLEQRVVDVSVVVPVYNREKTIRRCVKSLINQSILPKEINLVDDGSNDRSISIMKEIEDKYSFIHVYYQNHKGAQAARNRGIREANSEWITFLDSDDEWCPDFLENVSKWIEFDGNRDIVIYTSCYKDDGITRSPNLMLGFSGNVYYMLLASPGPMFGGIVAKKKSFQEIGYLDESCPAYQEWETSLRLSKNCEFIFINKPLFIYYVNQNITTISAKKNNNYMGWRYIVEKHKSEILRLRGRKTLARHYLQMAKRCNGLLRVKCLCGCIQQILIYIIVEPITKKNH